MQLAEAKFGPEFFSKAVSWRALTPACLDLPACHAASPAGVGLVGMRQLEVERTDCTLLRSKVSIEMIEAVGHDYLPGYFGAFDECLGPGGAGRSFLFYNCICCFRYFEANRITENRFYFSPCLSKFGSCFVCHSKMELSSKRCPSFLGA